MGQCLSFCRYDTCSTVQVDLASLHDVWQCVTSGNCRHSSDVFWSAVIKLTKCHNKAYKMLLAAQVLVTGKISQAVVVAAAAYRTEAEFRERTGIQQSKLIVDEFHTNTHVGLTDIPCTSTHAHSHWHAVTCNFH